LLGNGAGAFQTAVNYGAGTGPHDMVVGDFNDDGKLDLGVANFGSNNVSMLAGIGDGTFASAGNIAAATGPSAIVVTDCNRDGKPDLAVANGGSNNLSILLNTCPIPDLAVTKTHAGNFAQGDVGKTYTITVSNVGSAPTDGLVSVTDPLPFGLTVTALSGTGWVCTVANVTCARSDVLSAGMSYPAITLTVNVANNEPATLGNTATVSGGGGVNG